MIEPPLALHTWTLDTTPLATVLDVARRTGWTAIELRRLDFLRAREAGEGDATVLRRMADSGLGVACVGVQAGWMLAEGAELRGLLDAFAESCRWARDLRCPRIMSPVDLGSGSRARAVANLREAAALAAAHGVRLALEQNYRAAQFDTLNRVREVVAAAGSPACGVLLDSYHLVRSGSLAEARDVAPAEVAHVQYSDVPAGALDRADMTNRLAPGQGIVPFPEFFRMVRDLGYDGPLSYEAPNPATWIRPPEDVAREALAATRAILIQLG